MMLITVDITDCIQTLDCCAPPTGTQSIHSIVLLVRRKQSKCKYNLCDSDLLLIGFYCS